MTNPPAKPDPADTLQAAQDLTDQVAGLNARLDEQGDYGVRNRFLIWVTIGSLVLNTFFTAALTVFIYDINHSSNEAKAAAAVALHSQQTQYQGCLQTNRIRSEALGLWQYVLSSSEADLNATKSRLSGAEYVQRQKAIADFRERVRVVYAPDDCSKLVPKAK